MQSSAYAYQVNHLRLTVSTAITIMQIKAGAATPFDLGDFYLFNTTSEISQQEAIQVVRKSGAATVTSFTPLKRNPADPTAGAAGGTSATGITASAEGTDTDVMDEFGFNVLNGIAWIWIPELRIHVQAAGIVGVKFPVAPTSSVFTGHLSFVENP